MSKSRSKDSILFTDHKESEVYITALLFFQRSLPAVTHTFWSVHKLPDFIGEAGFSLLPNPRKHRFSHFFITDELATK